LHIPAITEFSVVLGRLAGWCTEPTFLLRWVIAMRVAQLSWSKTASWGAAHGDRTAANLVFFFGTRQALSHGARYCELRAMFPDAHILGCGTGGQIRNDAEALG
jgi:hypothetical protein